MKEFTLDLSEHFLNGLRPSSRLDRRTKFLTEAKNVRNIGYGLEYFPGITDPFSGGVTVSFPFPQLLRGSYESLLAYQTSLYSVDESVDPWTSEKLTIFETIVPSPYYEGAIAAGGVWHHVDLGNAFFLFNGASVVYRAGVPGSPEGLTEIHVRSDVPIKTGCNFRGRTVIGGFEAGNFWTAEWVALFEEWKDRSGDMLQDSGYNEIGENWIAWSSPGGNEFPLWLLWPSLATQAWDDLGMTEENLLFRMKRGDFGWMPMPWQGSVLCVKPLGNILMVYGEQGIAALRAYPGDEITPPTFGLLWSKNVGVMSRGSVGGDDSQHVFIDTSANLWVVDEQKGAIRLGYQSYLVDTAGEHTVISFDSQTREYYISSESVSFVFNGRALYEITDRITSGAFTDGAFVGLFAEGADSGVALSSSAFDLGVRGVNTITGVALGVDSDARVEVSLSYRYDKSGDFQQTKWVSVNREGYAAVRAAGTDFRIHIRAETPSTLDLDYVQVKYQLNDKRSLRGPVGLPSDASALSSGTGE